MRAGLLFLLTVFGLALIALPADAHKVGLSRLTVDDDRVELGLAAAEAALLEGAPALSLSGCALSLEGAREDAADGEPGRTFTFDADCAPGARVLTAGFLDELGPSHRTVVTVERGGAWHTEAVLTAREPRVDLGVDDSSAAAFLGIGVEHILIGLDHLLFLFALVLLPARGRDLLKLVTAFTVAHSLTLGAGVLGWLSLPGSVVEPLIALSVAWVGVENFTRPRMDQRWKLTFAFGLVHGLGFAGVLGDIGLPARSQGLALLLFNLGVELGQLMVLALVLPALLWLRRRRGFARFGAPALSVLVVVTGLFWFIERVL